MRNAPLTRRFGAILYDGLLIVALMFLGTLPFIAAHGGEPVPSGDIFYRLVLLAIAWVFLAGFWARSGRTLGMQSWRLLLETTDGEKTRHWGSVDPFFRRHSVVVAFWPRLLVAIVGSRMPDVARSPVENATSLLPQTRF